MGLGEQSKLEAQISRCYKIGILAHINKGLSAKCEAKVSTDDVAVVDIVVVVVAAVVLGLFRWQTAPGCLAE